MPQLAHQERPLTEADFHTFEQLFNRRVPASFKKHYLQSNGGFPAEEDVAGGRWGLPVNGFNPILYGKLTIERLLHDIGDIVPADAAFGKWTGASYIPFAYDVGGNVIFLSLRDEDYGPIYVYAPDGRNIFQIAASFEAFLSKLYAGNE